MYVSRNIQKIIETEMAHCLHRWLMFKDSYDLNLAIDIHWEYGLAPKWSFYNPSLSCGEHEDEPWDGIWETPVFRYPVCNGERSGALSDDLSDMMKTRTRKHPKWFQDLLH